jgi:hypothetical protein
VRNRNSISSAEIEIVLIFTLDGKRVSETYLFSGVVELKIEKLLLRNYLYLQIRNISSCQLEGIHWDIIGFEMDNPISFKCESFQVIAHSATSSLATKETGAAADFADKAVNALK